LANLVQFQRTLMSCLEDWGPEPLGSPYLRHWTLSYHVVKTQSLHLIWAWIGNGT